MAGAAALACQPLAWIQDGGGKASKTKGMEQLRRTEGFVINTLIPETHMNTFAYFHNVRTC